MSKVTFRARQIDYNKPLAIICWSQSASPDPNEYTSMLKIATVSTGMEKEEETEFHLRELLVHDQASDIPVPDVTPMWDLYHSLYSDDFVLPEKYLSSDSSGWLSEEPIDYDIDNEDESWLRGCCEFISPAMFEKLMDRYEKGCSNKGLRYDEALALARSIPDVFPAQIAFVYDYWLKKRIENPTGLIFRLKQESHDSSGKSANDPYVAFRRRSEKMQTRKNRKNDEHAYEKMFYLGQHLRYLQKIVQDVYLRESCKEKLDGKEMAITKAYTEHDHLLSESESYILKSLRLSRSLYSTSTLVTATKKRTIDNHSIYKKLWKAKNKTKRRKNELSGTFFSDDFNIFDSGSDHEFEFVRRPGVQFERPRADVFAAPRSELYANPRFGAVENPEMTRLPAGTRLRYGRNNRLILDRVITGHANRNEDFQHLNSAEVYRPMFPVPSQRFLQLLEIFTAHERPYSDFSRVIPDRNCDLGDQKSREDDRPNVIRSHHCDSGTGSRPNSPETILLPPLSDIRAPVPPSDNPVAVSSIQENPGTSDCDIPFVHSNIRTAPTMTA